MESFIHAQKSDLVYLFNVNSSMETMVWIPADICEINIASSFSIP